MSASPNHGSLPYSLPATVAAPVLQHIESIRSTAAILERREMLANLADCYELRGEMDDLPHFLQTREAQRKHPHLLLVPVAGVGVCAVLLFEYRALTGLRVFSSADYTGRRNVLAPPGQRARVAALAAKFLLEQGAQVVHVSIVEGFRDSRRGAPLQLSNERTRARVAGVLGENRPGLRGSWSLTDKDVPLYLALGKTMDETLATIGKKTRTNLRYYRRRAERELGAHFVPQVHVDLAELLRFNRRCTFAVPDAVVKMRMEYYQRMRSPFFCGLRDRTGDWLALAMGRHHHNVAELDWQMNRDDMPSWSLSTVLRSFWIEHEVERGARRLFLEGGTSSSLALSFVRQPVHELTLKRASSYVRVLSRLGKNLAPRRNYVAQLLSRSDLRWRPLGQAAKEAGPSLTSLR